MLGLLLWLLSAFSPLAAAEADAFHAALRALCGKSFAGEIVANTPQDPADPFLGQSLVMQVRECNGDVVRVPFHVGDDHSRTWVFTRTTAGLRLKHDHRHADGSPDATTLYGGDTRTPGSATRQEFPVDEESIALFQREGRTASTSNVWAVEITADTFVYELARPGRLFRVRFDLSREVAAPPPPWGASD